MQKEEKKSIFLNLKKCYRRLFSETGRAGGMYCRLPPGQSRTATLKAQAPKKKLCAVGYADTPGLLLLRGLGTKARSFYRGRHE